MTEALLPFLTRSLARAGRPWADTGPAAAPRQRPLSGNLPTDAERLGAVVSTDMARPPQPGEQRRFAGAVRRAASRVGALMEPERPRHSLAVPSSPPDGWFDRALGGIAVAVAVAVPVVLAVDEWAPERLSFAGRATILVVTVLAALAVQLRRKSTEGPPMPSALRPPPTGPSRRAPVEPTPALPHRSRWRRRLLLSATAVVVIVVVALAALLGAAPAVSDAENRVRALSAAHGVADTGQPAPAKVARALIATEDSRFSSHHGLDSLGALRAATGSLSNHDQGGSTLDQQFAKVVYTPGQSGVGAKLTQAGVALKLDANYSKPQILEMYLSSVYFGHGYWGLPAAARGYFGRRPGQLDWAQASMLAGLVQAPSAYDPINHRALAKSRQRHVLDRLVAVHAISAADADTVFVSPLGLR